ncbi:uncharacterized protein MELLADRAFT_111521 [Melampsora larici-populina 98AG31]|uniref:Uncharacterized protein n=1 Tax=Melampsora larici-populina (strain 98AG31 / pathotype 3-4-7) TaxID=747676 RepID=F4S3G4_MELLP|nr:uncharacterized protein MELLADRAFT_111521 [Melampsora larici-populina 98AG31]EGG00806.1 hypothetical protein MELLADRAFT_111521 [Melampsora larici-populina 98AG31]
MSLGPKILNYIHHHRLTRDEEWTLELASELIQQSFLKSSSVLSFTENQIQLDLENLWNGLDSNTQDLNQIIGDHWSISVLQVNQIKECLKELRKPLSDENVQLFNDDLFYQKFPYLEDDFLLTFTSIKTKRIQSKLIKDQLGVNKLLDFKEGKGSVKFSSEEDLMVEISTVEELMDIEPIYDLEQVISEKERVLEPWLGSEDLPIEFRSLLLEESSTIETHIPTCLTPPMMPREDEQKGVNLINQPTEMARLVINSMEEMEMTDSQPELSNDIWDELVTPPSSPAVRNKERPIKVSDECLIPKENEDVLNLVRSDKPILETILFPLKHQHSNNRSNSFDPSLYLNLRPFRPLPSKNQKHGNKNTLEFMDVEETNSHQVLIELETFLEKFDHEGDYENERFEIPNINTGSSPKRIKINATKPESPPMRRNSITGIYRPRLQDFGLSKGDRPNEDGKQWYLPLEFNKVEGLKSLNIDLSWTPYTLPEPLTVERLIDVEEAPQGCIAEISSTDSFEKDLGDSRSSILFDQENMIEVLEIDQKSKQDFKLIDFSSCSNSFQPIINHSKVDNILYDELNSKSESVIESYSIAEEESLITSKIEPTTENGFVSDDGRNVRFQEIEIDDDSPSIMSLHMSEGINNDDRSDSIQSISPIPELHTPERHVTPLSTSVQNPIRQKEFDPNHYVDYYPSFLDHHTKPAPLGASTSSENVSSRTRLEEKIDSTDDEEEARVIGVSDHEMEKIPVELFHEGESNENIIHDESTNQFDTISLSIVEENEILDNQNEENESRDLIQFSTNPGTPEKIQSNLKIPIVREKLSERLQHFMKSRKVKNEIQNSTYQEEIGLEKTNKDEEKTIRKNLKFNSTLPRICPPPPLSIQDQLYLPNPISINEVESHEKLIGFYSIRISENRYLKSQLENYFSLEESNEFDWKEKEKILKPDLIFQDQQTGLEIGIVFIRLSTLISGSYKPNEIEKIDNGEDLIEENSIKNQVIQEACFTSIYRLSKSFSRLLIVLEAYPIKPTSSSSSNELIAYAYTPPICNSLEILKSHVLKLEENVQDHQGDFNADLSVSESYERSCEIALQWVKEVLPST